MQLWRIIQLIIIQINYRFIIAINGKEIEFVIDLLMIEQALKIIAE